MAEAPNTHGEYAADESADDIVLEVQQNYRTCRDFSTEWREQARTAFDMDAGRQWDDETMNAMKEQNRVPVTFNRISRVVNAIVGTQIQNRQETRFIGRELGDVKESEIYTAAADYVRDNCDAEDEETDAFTDCIISGMGWTETRLDTEINPDGDILIERVDPLWMYWDPFSRRKNLDDRRWNMMIKRLSYDEFDRRWPDVDLESAATSWDDEEDEEGGIRRHVYAQDAYNERQSGASTDRTIRVAHYQFYELEDVYRIGPKATPFKPSQFQRMKAQLDEAGIRYVKQKRRIYKQCFVAGNQLLGKVEEIPGDAFTFNCLTGRRDRNKNVWLGIVSAMIDPQMWGNKFFSQILDIINKNAKGGVIAEKSAFDDPAEVEEKWARPDAVHWARDGAVSGNKILPKPTAGYPEGLDKLMIFSLENVQESAGMSMETLGLSQQRQQAGVVEYQRRQQGLTVLAPYFDALRLYRKVQGRVLLDFIKEYISDGRLVRIMGEDGNEEYRPLNREEGASDFDIIVDESPTSPNQKEKVFNTMHTLLPNLVQMGVPLPKELLDYAPLPSKLASSWKEEIDKSKSQQLPPEVELKMAEGMKQIEKLTEENKKLKDKREETQANMQLKAMEQQGKREDSQMDLNRKREELEAELIMARQKFGEELELQRQKTAAELELDKIKMEHQFAIEEQKLDLQRRKDAAQTDIDVAGTVKKTLSEIPKTKRKLTVNRDKDGMLVDAIIEDMLEDTDTSDMARA